MSQSSFSGLGGRYWIFLFAFVAFSVGMTGIAISTMLTGRAAADEVSRLHALMTDCPRVPVVSVPPREPPPTTTPRIDPTAATQSIEPLLLAAGVRLSGQREKSEAPQVTLTATLPAKMVGVLNLWSPTCGPCMEEMPLLKNVLARKEWKGKVQFIPVHTTDEDASRSDYTERMPRMDWFLKDFDPERGLTPELRRNGIYRENTLPITYVVDCQFAFRWVHFGRLFEEDVRAFEDALRAVTKELSSEKCAPPDVSPRSDPGPSAESEQPR